MIFSIFATLGLVVFQRYVVSKTDSLAIRSDSLHYKGDLLVNLTVIIALLLVTNFGWVLADPIFGIAIAIYILYNAWLISRDALDMLMDRELPDADRQRIQAVILRQPQVEGLHDLRTRSSGPQTFIQCHIEMDGNLSLTKAHSIADQVAEDLRREFPGAEVIIHQDPYPDQAGAAPE